MDELFTRKLGNMEVTPPEDGWIRIENELIRRRSMTRKYWMAAASIALILSVTATVVYVQTNVPMNPPATIVAMQENTSQYPEEQPVTVSDDHVAVQKEIRQNLSVTQKNENNTAQAETPTNVQIATQSNDAVADISDVLKVSDILDISDTLDVIEIKNDTHSNIPVYTDSWNELLRMQPIKENWRETTSQKIAQLKLKTTDEPKDEMVVVAMGDFPAGYDEIMYVDITNSTAKSQPRRRWEMSGQFAPMYSYRAISSVPSGIRRSDFDNAESALLAYSGGIALSYRVFNRLSVQTGVFYLQMGQSINSVIPVTNMYAAVSSNNLYTKNFVRTSSGSVTVASNLKSDANSTYSDYFNPESQMAVTNNSMANASIPAYKLIERLDYLEIPMILRYRIIDRRVNLYVLGGMSANVLINNNVFVDNGSETVRGGTILMARPVNYSGTVGLGIGYQITRNLSFGLEPSFKYYLQPYTTSGQIDSNPYAFGVFSGVVYRF